MLEGWDAIMSFMPIPEDLIPATASTPETLLEDLGLRFDPDSIPWDKLKAFGLFSRIMPSMTPSPTAGKVLQYARQQVMTFRASMGLQVCVFKVGVTSNPIVRYRDYVSKNFTCMWVIFESNSVLETHMLEAALISHFQNCLGCRNKPGSGGEGALNRTTSSGPFYTYVTGGRADQGKWVG